MARKISLTTTRIKIALFPNPRIQVTADTGNTDVVRLVAQSAGSEYIAVLNAGQATIGENPDGVEDLFAEAKSGTQAILIEP